MDPAQNKALFVEDVTESSKSEAIEFLLKYEDWSLFLLGNLEVHGPSLNQEPNSGNFKFIRNKEKIVGVFCLARRGNLLVQAEAEAFDLIYESCKVEKIPIKGLIGNHDYCSRLWEYLKFQKAIIKENHFFKEVLYSMELSQFDFPKQSNVRFLQETDFAKWHFLNLEYLNEEGLPNDLSEEQTRTQFLKKAEDKIIWGYFLEGRLAAIAELNAKALDLGQVGGVFTTPELRKKGFAKSLMMQIANDAKNLHKIRKLIIFTGENNVAARKVYESLGVKKVGYYALIFGE